MAPETLHQQMLEPSFYPDHTKRVDYVETHISHVYLLDTLVYKVKKPVNFGFLDFTSLDQRMQICQNEVRLNRRFSTGIYLGVLAISYDGHRYSLQKTGEPQEYTVKMRRLPEDRMLNNLLKQGAIHPTQMTCLGHHLAQLHRQAPICRNDEGIPELEHIRYNWQENFNQTQSMLTTLLAPEGERALRRWIEQFLKRQSSLLQQREVDGWVREGHGDLHAAHICLTEPIQIFDCIEFNRRFRVSDILSDLAFLLMDLQHYGHGELIPHLWEGYQADLDQGKNASILLPFYLCYRAFVRGKVYGFQASDDAASRSANTENARRYFAQALAALLPQSLILVGGMMGTGKSSLCRALSSLMPCQWLRSDELRETMYSKDGSHDSFRSGQYTPEKTDAVYRQLLQLAEKSLENGQTVLVDASFSATEHRHAFYNLAGQRAVPVVQVLASCPPPVARRRLAQRSQENKDPSNGRPELYASQASNFELPSSDEPYISVDTSGSLNYTLQQMLGHILERVG